MINAVGPSTGPITPQHHEPAPAAEAQPAVEVEQKPKMGVLSRITRYLVAHEGEMSPNELSLFAVAIERAHAGREDFYEPIEKFKIEGCTQFAAAKKSRRHLAASHTAKTLVRVYAEGLRRCVEEMREIPGLLDDRYKTAAESMCKASYQAARRVAKKGIHVTRPNPKQARFQAEFAQMSIFKKLPREIRDFLYQVIQQTERLEEFLADSDCGERADYFTCAANALQRRIYPMGKSIDEILPSIPILEEEAKPFAERVNVDLYLRQTVGGRGLHTPKEGADLEERERRVKATREKLVKSGKVAPLLVQSEILEMTRVFLQCSEAINLACSFVRNVMRVACQLSPIQKGAQQKEVSLEEALSWFEQPIKERKKLVRKPKKKKVPPKKPIERAAAPKRKKKGRRKKRPAAKPVMRQLTRADRIGLTLSCQELHTLIAHDLKRSYGQLIDRQPIQNPYLSYRRELSLKDSLFHLRMLGLGFDALKEARRRDNTALLIALVPSFLQDVHGVVEGALAARMMGEKGAIPSSHRLSQMGADDLAAFDLPDNGLIQQRYHCLTNRASQELQVVNEIERGNLESAKWLEGRLEELYQECMRWVFAQIDGDRFSRRHQELSQLDRRSRWRALKTKAEESALDRLLTGRHDQFLRSRPGLALKLREVQQYLGRLSQCGVLKQYPALHYRRLLSMQWAIEQALQALILAAGLGECRSHNLKELYDLLKLGEIGGKALDQLPLWVFDNGATVHYPALEAASENPAAQQLRRLSRGQGLEYYYSDQIFEDANNILNQLIGMITACAS